MAKTVTLLAAILPNCIDILYLPQFDFGRFPFFSFWEIYTDMYMCVHMFTYNIQNPLTKKPRTRNSSYSEWNSISPNRWVKTNDEEALSLCVWVCVNSGIIFNQEASERTFDAKCVFPRRSRFHTSYIVDWKLSTHYYMCMEQEGISEMGRKSFWSAQNTMKTTGLRHRHQHCRTTSEVIETHQN